MKAIILSLILVIFFSQCKKEELPIPKRADSNLIVQSVNMNTDYKYQIFFDLESNSMTGSNVKTDWDLAFNCNILTPAINLNGAKYMSVWNTGYVNFADIPDVQLAEWKYDTPESHIIQTAFGNQWITQNGLVYVVDRGYDPSGALLGYFKCTISLLPNGSFEIKSADLDGDNETTIIITPDIARNRLTYSYDTKDIVSFEPKKDNWDILFSQYTYVYPDSQTYLVNGVLINEFETRIAIDSVMSFSDITIADTNIFEFTNRIDEIGFDWKYYDFSTGSFIILPNKSYVIKTSESKVFKLRFIDFYDENGVKGFPTFEFQEL
ncbi:MAG: hypothetical protein ACI8Q1_000620 [Parvicella sp.]|jgi:hypothetical protein